MRYYEDQIMRGQNTKPKRIVSLVGLLMLLVAYLLVQATQKAEAVNISDEPMETKVVSASPNIMFILDNSGSMDWEFMVKKKMDGTPTDDGRFENDYGYLYDSGDNLFDTSSQYGHIVTGSNRLKWLSQWSGWNKMYYNPAMTYLPWPTMPDASTTTPRANPANASPTFNLGDTYYYLARTETAVIVDNRDGAPYFTLENSNNWTESGRTPEWAGYSIYTGTTGESATFTPDLPQTGNYAVYAWWNCYTDRDGNAKITIVHSEGSDEVYRSQRATYDDWAQAGICGQWISLGEYPFTTGTAGSVTIERHSGSTGSSTIADAIKFVFQEAISGDVDIKNAHYYTVDDLDGDGEWDDDEPVYLVNFIAGARRYYRLMDANGVVASNELYSITDLPESVRPRFYDDDGNPVYKTDAQDLQNFANWYSYYRRRELAAKAAVSNAINTLEGVQVGFYSINSGLRQTVLPVKSQGNALIVDNLDSGYSSSYGWYEGSYSNEYKNSSKYTGTSGRWAKWTPNLPKTDTYKVYAWWNYYYNGDTNALYTINHAGGTETVRKNQKNSYSQWTLLGTYAFNAGSSGYVQVTRDGLSGGTRTNADAVMFELVTDSFYADETNTLLNLLYGMDSSGGTPLRNALKEVGQYFNAAENSDLGETGSEPWKSADDGGACQQAFAILMTDGYWNGTSPSVGNQDGGQGTPYADNYSDTLADVAMKYYKTDLSSTLDNSIPTNSCDSATWQHMVTYGVSFGLKGTLDPSAYHPCLLDGSEPVWPNPNPDNQECPERIDDLYHATVNGRGLFFNASNPEELVDSLAALMENIESRMASGASVSVNGEELGTDTVLYQASYSSDTWTGEVKAFPVDRDTGAILREESDIKWSASDLLQSVAPDDRLIATYNGTTAGTAFRYISLTDAQKAALDPVEATAMNVLDYIRGEEIVEFRPRTRKLGDIVHSAPLYVGNTVYVGANDGMLHAFNATTGKERFAYVPNLVLENLKYLTAADYTDNHRFFVDLTPVARSDVQMGVDDAGTLLVGGLGKGGKGYYALDITDADSLSSISTETEVAAMVKWEYPKVGVTDDDLGYSFSRAFIVRTYSTTYPWVIIFGNGYNSTNGKAVLYILDIDGNLIVKIDTGVGDGNGLSTPSLVDVNGDFKVDYVYAGDLKGNLWKFDLTVHEADYNDWQVAFGIDNNGDNKISFADGDVPKPLFTAPGQPITIKPDVMRHCKEHGYIVVFGTGIYLDSDPSGDPPVQTVYGIWDYGDDGDNGEVLGTFDRATGVFSNTPFASNVTLLEQEELLESPVILYGHKIRLTTDYEPNWEKIEDTDTGQDANPGSSDAETIAHAGWYFDLPVTGERVIKDLMIRDGMAVFTSFTPNDSECSGGGNSMVHEMNACSGARPPNEKPQFDINNDGVIDENDLVNIGDDNDPIWVAPTGKEYTGLLHPPVVLTMPDRRREMKVFSTSAGTTVTLFERGERRGIFYWVERSGN